MLPRRGSDPSFYMLKKIIYDKMIFANLRWRVSRESSTTVGAPLNHEGEYGVFAHFMDLSVFSTEILIRKLFYTSGGSIGCR